MMEFERLGQWHGAVAVSASSRTAWAWDGSSPRRNPPYVAETLTLLLSVIRKRSFLILVPV